MDRLGWTVGFTRKYRGIKLGFRADRPETLTLLQTLLEPLGTEPCSEEEVEFLYSYRGGGQRGRLRDYHLLYMGARQVVRTLDGAAVAQAMNREINLLVGVAAPDSFCLRGGAVIWEGRALVVVGPEGAGTSTLLSALVRAGARQLVDSFVLFDGSTGQLVGPAEGYAVAAVLVTRYQAHQRFRPQQLSPGQAAAELFGCAPAAAVRASRLLPQLVRLATEVPVWKGDRCSSGRAARQFLDLYH